MKLFKWLFALLILIVVIAGAVAWTLPADVAYRYVATRLGPISLVGVRGTVWSGHADGVSVFGRDLGELDWQVEKLPLFARRVHADLRIRGADIVTSGLVERDADGRITAHDVRFRVPASLMSPVLDVPSLKLLGTITGTFAKVSLYEGLISDANGTARWSEAGVTGTAEARFSDILADFASKPDGSIAGTVADDGKGNLEVNGQFRMTAAGFEVEAFLAARNDDPRVQDALRYVGQPQPDGSSHLVITGQLFKLF
ncbi:MAG TPA: type II secretion system protein N [Dokdonella sp.]|uniref:type II secretion system protein N n=1 Tax=Dokdonella sp. TaxID=2291710 RepID=UPI002D7F0826|nr:type II secretion system protein N [Dokdonella sp.]HET9033000.1 type II secretion system protein N [Dokdonella sp.]